MSEPASEPDSTSEPASEPDSTSEPASEPDSTSEPASEPDSTSEPASEPDSTSEPGSDAELAVVLEDLSGARNYEAWILDLLAPSLADPVLELGAGTGNLTAHLAAGHQVVAVEPSPRHAATLIERFADDPRVTAVQGDAEGAEGMGTYGCAVAVNVVEHIEDHVGAVSALGRAVEPGGHIALYVPAFPLLYSDFDRRIGHHRRYTRASARTLVRESGLELVELRYVNSVGWLAWLLTCRLLKGTPTKPGPVRIYDTLVVPWLRRIEDRFTPPFGQSLLVVARRPPAR